MAAGAGGTLWRVNYKINANYRGFNQKFHFAGVDLPTAISRANLIGAYLRAIMPTDAEIFFATVSNDNTLRDGKYCPNAIGNGTYVPSGPNPPSTHPDLDRVCVQIRMESDGGVVPIKICPIPDEFVTASEVTELITAVTSKPNAAPAAAGSGANWAANFNLLMQAITYYSHHVKSGHAPGGAYTYFDWSAAFYVRVSTKKGAHIFN